MINRYQQVTDRIVADLEAGVATWVKPWRDGGTGVMPCNAVSRRYYSGVNVLVLWGAALAKGFAVPRWLTYNQAKGCGGNVRKGEKGETVFFVTRITKEGENGEREFRPIMRYYTVFNVAQCDGIPAKYLGKEEREKTEVERIAAAEGLLKETGAKVLHGGNSAFYSHGDDSITLPPIEAFETVQHYYATSLHEHAHWTGHKDRLAREFGKRFGDQAYAAEELVAELGAAFLCAHLGIEGELRHSEYIGSWIQLLKDNPRAIFTAASKASAAADYLRGFSEEELEQDTAA